MALVIRMDGGELATRVTAWIALAGWTAAVALLKNAGAEKAGKKARIFWTLGLTAFSAHIFFAFHWVHHWSHSAALKDTARQTAAVTGLDWGGGLWLNYLFALLWTVDCVWWWASPKSHLTRPKWMAATFHSFFAFMWFNALVVFGTWPARLLGIASMMSILMYRRKRTAD